MNLAARCLVFLTPLLLAANALADGTIILRPSAKVAPGAPVTLAMVAELRGAEAEALKDVVVASAPSDGGSATLDLAGVRKALDKGRTVNWGKLALSGSSCAVRGEAPVAAPIAQTPRLPAPEAVAHGPVETVRSIVAQRAAEQFGVALDDLRIRLTVNGSNDTAWIDAPVEAGVRCEIVQLSAPNGSRMALRIDQYQRDRLVLSRPVMADILVRRSVVSATVRIEREQAITAEMLALTDDWLSPTVPFVNDVEQVAGCTARKRLEPGRPIGAADVQMPLVIQRGESIWVDVLSGGIVVRAKAKAMAAGRDGELVPFQIETTKKTFMARMNGRGRAVMEIDPSASEGGSFQVSPPEQRPAARKPPAISNSTLRRKNP